MNYLKLNSLKTLTGYILTFLLMLLTACEDKDSQKISIVKSERVQEKHPEISISKTAGEESLSTQVTKDIFKEITEQENRSALYEDTVFPLSKLGRPSTDPQPGIILNQNDAAASIMTRIDSNKGHKKRPVHVLYFNPSDRQPVTDYQNRIQKIMTELQDFYGKGMEQNGFGYRTFNLEMVKDRLKIHLILSDKAAKAYARDSKTAEEVYSLSAKKLKESGIDLEKETAIVFQNLGKGDDRTFFDTSAPYYGTWNTNSHRKGFCYVVDSKFLNWKNLTNNNKQVKFNGEKSMSLGELASGQIGGVCHELGHAFCLNHTHSNLIQNEKYGTALMGYGNWTFKQEMRNEGKGSYLSFVSAVKLLGHPCFSEIKSGGSEVQITDIALNSMNGILEIQGTLFSSPDIYSVIAYCDDLDKPSDYDAGGWVGTVDNMGKFQISINELNPDKSYQVNLQFLFVNGKESTETVLIKTNKSGAPEIDSSVKEKIILKNALKEKLKGNLKKTETILRELSSANKSESVQFLINTIKVMDKETDVNAVGTPSSVKEIYLSQLKWEKAYTGYSQARNNRLHEDNTQNPWPFLTSSKNIHRFGLYAHANSEYTYKLDGKWKKLKGKYSLKKGMTGSVKFIILADGKELFNSGEVTDSRERSYKVNLQDVQELKLIVNDAGNGKNSDWGQWLSPKLSR